MVDNSIYRRVICGLITGAVCDGNAEGRTNVFLSIFLSCCLFSIFSHFIESTSPGSYVRKVMGECMPSILAATHDGGERGLKLESVKEI